MRHGKKDNHLSRTYSHRQAMLSNMATSLILHKRIETTVAKARELRKYVEPLLTRAKEDSFQSRKVVFQYLNNKETMKELFGVVADKIANRPGGYTRIIKLGNRLGDNAQTCLVELVDFNETLLAVAEEQAATKTRRSRRGGRRGTGATAETAPAGVTGAQTTADAEPAVEASAADVDTPEVAAPDAPATDTDNSSEEPKQS